MNFENLEVGGRSFTVAAGEPICPGYMQKTIVENKPDCFIPVGFTKKGGQVKALYETDTKRSVMNYLMENGADEQWIKCFFISLDGLLSVCGEYLIDSDFINIDIKSVYYSEDSGEIKYIFNPFEKGDFKSLCRKLLADIAGNYFIDHAVSGELFRERLLREIGKKDFNIRNTLARWESLSYCEIREQPREKKNKDTKKYKAAELFNYIAGMFNKKEEQNATMAVTNITGEMCLTGICSINTRIPIKEEGVTVGRTMLQKEFGLYNSGIGKIHARIYKQDGYIYATDLGSKNGTYLNGDLLDKRVPAKMERGDILAFSDEEFILC